MEIPQIWAILATSFVVFVFQKLSVAASFLVLLTALSFLDSLSTPSQIPLLLQSVLFQPQIRTIARHGFRYQWPALS
jgi:hypothetical protein